MVMSLHITLADKRMLLLLRTEGARGEQVGRDLMLMLQGHTVFFSDGDSDVELFGDVVDAVIDVRALDRNETAAQASTFAN
jgi:hypothetical protein